MVIEALLTRDTEVFTKMDPYVMLQTKNHTFKTHTMQGAGKTPKWDQAFDIDLNNLGADAPKDTSNNTVQPT